MRSESKELIRAKAIGRKQSNECVEKRRLKMLGKTVWNKGKSGYKLPQCANKGEKNPMYGKPVPKKICPHCNKEVDIRNFARSHGNKCKFK